MEDEASTRLRNRAQRWTAVLAAVGLAFAGFAAVPAQAQDVYATLADAFEGQRCVEDICINRTLTSKAFPVEPVPKEPDRGQWFWW